MLAWLDWQNPVAIWWFFLVFISLINIVFWFFTFVYLSKRTANHLRSEISKPLLVLSAAYVFGCAFRSFLPRADVQRIVLFDTWFSSVLLGRTVATIAELCFIAQWAIVLRKLGQVVKSKITSLVSLALFPMIFAAECFSWYAVIRTHYIGNTIEESLWALSYALIGVALFSMIAKFKGAMKYAVTLSTLCSLLYVAFMVFVDVPMYFHRWQLDVEQNKILLGFFQGFADLNSRWHLTHDIAEWKTEIPWMSLYFSVGVWTSIALCYVPISRDSLKNYLNHY